MQDRRICLIGGSGFIGSYIAERLAEQEAALTIATRNRDRNKAALIVLPKTEVVSTNVHHPLALQQLLAGHDTVISMVGILHGTRKAFERAHVELLDKIIASCHKQGIRRLLHISALGADANAPSDYQQTKGIAEQRLRESGLDWTILRPSVVFGRGDSFLTLFAGLLDKLPLLPLAGANTRFAPVWADDLARAVVACLQNPHSVGQSLDLTGPRSYTLAELVRYVGQLRGTPRPVIGLPQGIAMLQAGLMELLPGPTLMSRDNVRSLAVDNVSPQPFPSALLGFAPTPLEVVAPQYLGQDEFNLILSDYRREAAR
ncbi:complex I NDUFA9 subunit family protein [Aquitalea palustris]|uniref:Complex I NDUFA9 subunit family protein n=1 Tax=Aquitalea palustris TaxID=2480983 RepID=A0A454JLI6_9NEIS|nr:complex I NDUFA9 subunit family protein [Aquitalea palustris]RMD00696.1 complex I NDUFA9 subunit family protein [Aquitalea palustris]